MHKIYSQLKGFSFHSVTSCFSGDMDTNDRFSYGFGIDCGNKHGDGNGSTKSNRVGYGDGIESYWISGDGTGYGIGTINGNGHFLLECDCLKIDGDHA